VPQRSPEMIPLGLGTLTSPPSRRGSSQGATAGRSGCGECVPPGEDQDIIQINKHELIEHVSEHVIHQHLENSGGIGETKGHHQVLVMSSGGIELVAFPDPDQVIGVAKIKFCKYGCPFK